ALSRDPLPRTRRLPLTDAGFRPSRQHPHRVMQQSLSTIEHVRIHASRLFRRTTYPLVNKEAAIDLTIDRGKIDSGHSSLPVCELELELKRGDKNRLFEIARTIERAFTAQLRVKRNVATNSLMAAAMHPSKLFRCICLLLVTHEKVSK